MSKNLADVEVHNLSHSYGKQKVLENVNFNIEKGSFVGLFGPNGGGKTTLLRLLMGLEKPSQGYVRLLGKDPKALRPQIGYVPQINNLDKQFPLTTLELVLMGFLSTPMTSRTKRSQEKEKALSTLEQVGLKGKENHHFGSLSGGQAQRALIARAIVHGPEILFLDEPTASVDPEAEQIIINLLLTLQNKMTILMVTHDLQTIIKHVKMLLCVHRQVHPIAPDQVCEHYGLGLYHTPIVSLPKSAP